jgi:hypothetical protein
MRTITGLTLVSFLALACAAEPDPVSPELRELGVASITVVETPSRLAIEGRGRDHAIVARLELVVGRFTMEEEGRGEVDGRQLAIAVLERTVRHESEGRLLLHLPMPQRREIAVFVADPVVASRLATWGIEIDAQSGTRASSSESEVPYAFCDDGIEFSVSSNPYGSCTASTYGGCTAGQKVKFVKSGSEYGEYRCCISPQRLFAERACTAAWQSTSCGQAGPNGCAVCWTEPVIAGENCAAYTMGGYCAGRWCGF